MGEEPERRCAAACSDRVGDRGDRRRSPPVSRAPAAGGSIGTAADDDGLPTSSRRRLAQSRRCASRSVARAGCSTRHRRRRAPTLARLVHDGPHPASATGARDATREGRRRPLHYWRVPAYARRGVCSSSRSRPARPWRRDRFERSAATQSPSTRSSRRRGSSPRLVARRAALGRGIPPASRAQPPTAPASRARAASRRRAA